VVGDDRVVFRLHDPDGAFAWLRLRQDLQRPREGPYLVKPLGTDVWELTFGRPAVDRMEYAFEGCHHSGGVETFCDADNPLRAPGAFGDRSVVEFPGYRAPAWCDDEPLGGQLFDTTVPSFRLRADVSVRIWTSRDADPEAPLPLLIAHDGSEYARMSELPRLLDRMTQAGRLPPLRAVLLDPMERNEHYSASAAYARALAGDIVPALAWLAPNGQHPIVGMGASLGALAMLHVHRSRPGVFAGLFLQSGSFFRQRYDRQVGLPALSADRALRGGSPQRVLGISSDPSDADVRRGRGEPGQQPRGHPRAAAPGLRRAAAGQPRRTQLRRLARHLRSEPGRPAGAGLAVRRERLSLRSPATGAHGEVIAYGHHGRPLIAFASQQGDVGDWERNGMVDAVRWLIDGGRLKVYSVSSYDSDSWFAPGVSLEEAARRHGRYEDWLVHQVVGFIHDDCGGPLDILVTGCSFGAYHAANLTLRRADLFPVAICMSGVYDISLLAPGERGDAVYFNNPVDYVANLDGSHLQWLREQARLLLICGQGMWEDTTGALESTRRFAALLAAKGLTHEADLWGYDVAHDWPSWRAQLAHHLPRFV